MKPTRAFACLLFVVLFFGLAILLSALRRPAPSGPNTPIPGKIRISVQKVAEDKTTVHWRWTIIGDRPWASFSSQTAGTDEVISLQTESNPLAGLMGPSGSSKIVYELQVQKGVPTSPGQTSYTEQITMQGANGSPTLSSSGSSSAAYSSMGELVTILTLKDVVLPLPARVSLAKVAGKTRTLQFSK